MKHYMKVIVTGILISTALCTVSVAAQTDSIKAYPSDANIIIDGNTVSSCAYNIYGSNYFKLRDIAYMLNGSSKQFSVGWDRVYVNPNNNYEDFKRDYFVLLENGKEYIPAGGELEKGNGDIKAAEFSAPNISLTENENSKRVTLVGYNIDDNNYFKLRDIAQIFDFGIAYDEYSGDVIIDTSSGYEPDVSLLTRNDGNEIGMTYESDVNLDIDEMPIVSYYTNDDTGYSTEQLELLREKPILRGIYIDVRELSNYGFEVIESDKRIDVERIPLGIPEMLDTEIIHSAPTGVYELYSDDTQVYVFGNRIACCRADDMVLIPITALYKHIANSDALYNSISVSMFREEIHNQYINADAEEYDCTQEVLNKGRNDDMWQIKEKTDIGMIAVIGGSYNYTGFGDREHIRNGKGCSVYGPSPLFYEHGIYKDNKLVVGVRDGGNLYRLGWTGSRKEQTENYKRESIGVSDIDPKFRFGYRVKCEGETKDGEYCGAFKAYDENGEVIFDGDYADYVNENKGNIKQ